MRDYRLWTSSEIDVLKLGIRPAGRSYHACVLICRRLQIPFPGKEDFDMNDELLKRGNHGRSDEK